MQVAVMVDRNQDGKFTCHPCTVSSGDGGLRRIV